MRLTVVLLALCLAACSSGTKASTASSTTSGPAAGVPAGAEDTGVGGFGDLSGVCGPGSAGGTTAQGVTDTSIRVGVVSDPRPDGAPANRDLVDASNVFVSWRNEAGGIDGRAIELVERDTRLTEYRSSVADSCREDFVLVGGGSAFDGSGQEERLTCLLPDLPAFQASEAARGADLSVAALPNPIGDLDVAAFRHIAATQPDTIADVGFLTANIASTVTADAQAQEAVETLGFEVTFEAQYNARGEASWTPFVEALRSGGVKGLVFTGPAEGLADLLLAATEVGYRLDWVVTGANGHDPALTERGGAAVADVFLQTPVVPPFLADENPATRAYLDLVDRYLPDGRATTELGIRSFSAWLLFATAAKACGSELTRRCVVDQAAAVTGWTGGGLHAPTAPGSGQRPGCGLVVEATPDGFALPDTFEATDGLFRCDDEDVAPLEGDYGRATTLADVGRTLDEVP